MACCGYTGNPFLQTLFCGASVVGFSANIGWGGTGGSLTVELVEDKCAGTRDGPGGGSSVVDSFNPPGVGSPINFSYGSFSHSGILQNWKQTNSATGPKSYVVNLTDPGELMRGYQVILDSYDGPNMGVPNLGNAYGWLEAAYGTPCVEAGYTNTIPGFASYLTYPPAAGFGGAFVNSAGMSWNLLRVALTNILNGSGGAFGGLVRFRGYYYYVDLSEVPPIPGDFRLSGESMSLDDIISEVCNVANVEYFYDLTTLETGSCTPSGSINIIRVRTSVGSWQAYDNSARRIDMACGSNVDNRLGLGTIGAAIASSACMTEYGRGVELKLDNTNAFITGEFRQELWQTAYEGDCDGNDTIWPYWGYNPDGTLIMGENCSDLEHFDKDNVHKFTIQTSHLGVGVNEWTITEPELRCAALNKNAWATWCTSEQSGHKQDYENILKGGIEVDFERINDTLVDVDFDENDADICALKAEDGIGWQKSNAVRLILDEFTSHSRITRLYDYVRRFADEFFGRQFMVKLPFLCRNVDPDAPWSLKTNWANSDSGWTEWPVLGLPNNHWIIESFRDDDRKIKCFVRFNNNKPLVLGNLNESEYVAPDMYNAYVEGTSDQIVWVSPTDARAIVKISGPVETLSQYDIEMPNLATFALTNIENAQGAEVDKFRRVIESIDVKNLSLPLGNAFLIPIQAAVPLQSERLVYGPWFAKKNDLDGFNFFGGGILFGGSDKGKTHYERNSGFSPWGFGSISNMNFAGYATASAMLGDKYVVEMGDITFPGSPSGSLGSLIASGGPVISGIDVTVGRGSGAVTTQYRMKTYTPDFGTLALKHIESMKRSINLAIKANSIFKKYTINRLKNRLKFRNYYRLLAYKVEHGMAGESVSTLLAGQSFYDIRNKNSYMSDDPALTNVGISDGRDFLRSMRPKDPPFYRRRALMENCGMFRPYSTLPTEQKVEKDDAFYMSHWENTINHDRILDGDCVASDGSTKITEIGGCDKRNGEFLTNNNDFFSHEQLPPIYCQEHQLPINITTLSPFLDRGRSLVKHTDGWGKDGLCMTENPTVSAGHDIEYIARDGIYPTHMNVSIGGYSENHWYRAIALKAPLVMAGWGFDIDNKPVPNASDSYPQNPKMAFEQDWLKKPHKWKCGPVDLRWDYKRNVWTAPTPMKIVELELEEFLIPENCANAILYNDQEQYDYYGDALDCQEGCRKTGYRVKVWSNSMYVVFPGWRIRAYYNTTRNRYEMVNHDSPPLLNVTLDEDILCKGDTGMATINYPAGGSNLDPCGLLQGKKVKIKNEMGQPMCEGRQAFVHVYGVQQGGMGEPGPTLDDCEKLCQDVEHLLGVIVQGEFHPEEVVTHLELLEYYCWGYSQLCDEDDITLYSQGEVETAWDWCLTDNTSAVVPSMNLSTSDASVDGHLTDNTIDSSDVIGSILSGGAYNSNASLTGSVELSNIEISGATEESGAHIHEIDISGCYTESSGVTIEGDGEHSHTSTVNVSGTGTGTTDEHSHSHTVNTTITGTGTGTTNEDCHTHNLTTTVTGTFSGSTSSDCHSHPFSGSFSGSGTSTTDEYSHTHSVTSLSGTISDFTANSTHAHYFENYEPGGSSKWTNGNTHRHSFDAQVDGAFGGTVDQDDHSHEVTMSISGTFSDVTEEDCHSHTFSGSFTGSGTGITDQDCHTHTVNTTITGTGTGATDTDNHTHDITTNVTGSGTVNLTGGTHSHSLTIPSLDISGCSGTIESAGGHTHNISLSGITASATLDTEVTLDIPSHTHGHSLQTPSLTVPSDVTIDDHSHSFSIPSQYSKDIDFDIDIDSRFVPGSCTLRVAVVNKNFWEFFVYELCICVRCLWTEAEMGGAHCDMNTTPEVNCDCEDIICEEPEYECPAGIDDLAAYVAGERNFNVEANVYYDDDTDEELLNLSTTCSEASIREFSVNASCVSANAEYGSQITGSGETDVSAPNQGTGNMAEHCGDVELDVPGDYGGPPTYPY